MNMGPNDARRVVWAICKFFLLLFRILSLINYYFHVISIFLKEVMKAMIKKRGPNDTSGVIWAIGESFFWFFYCYLIILGSIYNGMA